MLIKFPNSGLIPSGYGIANKHTSVTVVNEMVSNDWMNIVSNGWGIFNKELGVWGVVISEVELKKYVYDAARLKVLDVKHELLNYDIKKVDELDYSKFKLIQVTTGDDESVISTLFRNDEIKQKFLKELDAETHNGDVIINPHVLSELVTHSDIYRSIVGDFLNAEDYEHFIMYEKSFFSYDGHDFKKRVINGLNKILKLKTPEDDLKLYPMVPLLLSVVNGYLTEDGKPLRFNHETFLALLEYHRFKDHFFHIFKREITKSEWGEFVNMTNEIII